MFRSSMLVSAFFVLWAMPMFAQSPLPILKGNSRTVDIRDGNVLKKGEWTMVPEIYPDVYTPERSTHKKRIVFYSDSDSLVFDVKPRHTYDFLIVVKGDTALTRINYSNKKAPVSPIIPYLRACGTCPAGPDTLPFTIGEDHRIYLKGSFNGSDTLSLLFDTGASTCVLTASGIGEKVNVVLEKDSIENIGADGVTQNAVSHGNEMRLGALRWNNISLVVINYAGRPFDGVIGGNVFAGRRIQIDYEKKWLIILPETAKIPAGYTRLRMKMQDGVPYIQAHIGYGRKRHKGLMLFDTGSDWSLALNGRFTNTHKLRDVLPKIGTSTSQGSAGGKIESDLVILPKLQLAGYELYQIPITLGTKQQGEVGTDTILGNRLLKRFNVILDYKNGYVYLKPNNLLHMPYMQRLLK